MAPVLAKRWSPRLRSPIALAPIRTRAHRHQMLSNNQVVRVIALPRAIPRPSPAAVRIRQWHAVINIQIAGIGIGGTRVFVTPQTGHNLTSTRVQRWSDQRLVNENLLACVLAVTIGVNPQHPICPVILGNNRCWSCGTSLATSREYRDAQKHPPMGLQGFEPSTVVT